MKVQHCIYSSPKHSNERSHHVTIFDFDGKKVKFTYKAHNAAEYFTGEIFDGEKWNHLCSMVDFGIFPDSSAYAKSHEGRLSKAKELIKLGLEFTNKLFSK